MIDIIIPAYNAHDTIEDTLHSIAMQNNKHELHVIIVNDGGKNYKDIIKKFEQWLDIKEICCPRNCGPGYARNYGLQNSTSKYVMFIDADDALSGSYALTFLKAAAIDSGAAVVTSKVLEIDRAPDKEEYMLLTLEPNLMWLFGNLYSREFLEKYNIHFLNTCHNEDVGFNTLCAILSYHDRGDIGTTAYTNGAATYEWKWNSNSLSRQHVENELQKAQLNILGYIYTHLKAFQLIEEYITEPFERYNNGLMIVLFTLYQHHHLILNQENMKKNEQELANMIEVLSRYFCHKYYNLIGQLIPFSVFSEELINYINDLSPDEQDQLIMSFVDFIDLMFSKEPINNYNDLDIDSKLFKSKDND